MWSMTTGTGKRRTRLLQVGDLRHVDKKLHMPAEAPDSPRHALGVHERRTAAEHDVEAHATHAGLVEFIQFTVGAVGRRDGDA